MLEYYQNLEHLLVSWRSQLPRSSPYPFPLVLICLVHIKWYQSKVNCFLQRLPIYTITMSFQIFLSAEQQARLEKMRLDFLVWKDKFSKQIEKRPSPASQSPPIKPTPLAPPSVVDLYRSVHQ
jgi:hypothetical protein